MNANLLHQIFRDQGTIPEGSLAPNNFCFVINNLTIAHSPKTLEIWHNELTKEPIFKIYNHEIKEEPLVDLILNLNYDFSEGHSILLRRIMVDRTKDIIEEYLPNSDILYNFYSNLIEVRQRSPFFVTPYFSIGDNWKTLDRILTYLKITS